MNSFHQAASTWDDRPVHWERSEAIAKLIKEKTVLKPEMTALEFGAGTGILSYLLKDEFSHIVLMDNTPEMLTMIDEKIENLGITNFETLLFDLEKKPYHYRLFDVIFTQMAMHHVTNIPLVIERFAEMLKPEGYLAIADLYPEDGSFHAGGIPAVHNGIDTTQLCEDIKQAGFIHCHSEWCFTVKRTMEDGSVKEFPIFLTIAQKK
jgi:ubiquinone/menaquinone biosynthesis C-methylase UbiE